LTEKAIAHYGLIVVESRCGSRTFEFAPEHLELEVADPWALLEGIRHAGAILGYSTPEAVGLFGWTQPHLLLLVAPVVSALGWKPSKTPSLIQYSPIALQKVAGAIDVLAKAEGLPSHAESVRLQMQSQGTGDWELGGENPNPNPYKAQRRHRRC